MAGWVEELRAAAREQLENAIALRRRIHLHPEVGLDLPKTREAVLDALSGLDLEIDLCRDTSGILATLRGGRDGAGAAKGEGGESEGGRRRILLRADMDALPMPEDTGLDYASKKPDAMHACGHDAHTAMLVGAAHVLAERREELGGDVTFFFQPGEETDFGARCMLEEGWCDGPRAPEAVFAIHIDTRLPVGYAASKGGPILASDDMWSVEIKGQGGHASMPHNAFDPIPVACEMVGALQTMVTRRIHVFDPVVLTTSKIEAGSTHNVIPETAHISGTLRATSEIARLAGEEGLHRVAQGIAAAHGVEATVAVEAGYPPTVNDPRYTEFARGVAIELLGEERFIDLPTPLMGAEDFSYLLQRFPGSMIFLGLRPDGIEDPAPVHSNRMVLNEQGMVNGIALHAAIALQHFERESAP